MQFIKHFYKKIIIILIFLVVWTLGVLQLKHLLSQNEDTAGFTEKVEQNCVVEQCTPINYGFGYTVYLTKIKNDKKTVYESLDKQIYLKCKDLYKSKNKNDDDDKDKVKFTAKIAINNNNKENIKILEIIK